MRAVKSVLVMAGSLKRANPDLPEDIVLIRAMRDSNLPKFLVADVELFSNIISDLFPGVNVPDQVMPAASAGPPAGSYACSNSAACHAHQGDLQQPDRASVCGVFLIRGTITCLQCMAAVFVQQAGKVTLHVLCCCVAVLHRCRAAGLWRA